MKKIDAVVIGGSFSGMSAALQLARARRQIVVVDSGLTRNRYAKRSHGFLAQDGRAGEVILAEAKAQLLAYPNLRWVQGEVESAERRPDGFVVTTNVEAMASTVLILATGVVDDLPSVEGLSERWGTTVFHCPYCDGYELDNGRIGVLATSAMSSQQAMMLADWGSVTLFLNEAFVPDEAQTAALALRGVTIEGTRVVKLTDAATVELLDGRSVVLDGLFTLGATRMASPLAEQLGCRFDPGPFGPYIVTTETMETTVSGVFACGDAARMVGNIAVAVGDGALTGVFAHRSLIPGL